MLDTLVTDSNREDVHGRSISSHEPEITFAPHGWSFLTITTIWEWRPAALAILPSWLAPAIPFPLGPRWIWYFWCSKKSF